MELLKERIRQDGRILSPTILKVDSFLNHQVDAELTMAIGREFASHFKGTGTTKVLTVEASGIHFALATAFYLGVPFVYAKKKKAVTQGEDLFAAEAYSFTRQETYQVTIAKPYLRGSDKVLLIDDILANGAALLALSDIVSQAGAQIVGTGVVIEKSFQEGRGRLEAAGLSVHALARIKTMSENQVEFVEESTTVGEGTVC